MAPARVLWRLPGPGETGRLQRKQLICPGFGHYRALAMLLDVDGTRFGRGSGRVWKSVWRVLLALPLCVGCADAGSSSEPKRESPTEKAPQGNDAGATSASGAIDDDAYCRTLCDRGKSCDEAYDRQTCLRQCQSESGVITNLSSDLTEGWTECVDNTSCSTIGTERFVAECLADAANHVEPSDRGSQFCAELRRAADECSFTDYDERACWRAVTAYSEVALESGIVCAKKRCELIVDCLEATLKLPSEPDGSPIGFDDQGLSSGRDAVPAEQSLLPETSLALPPSPIVAPGVATSVATGPSTETPATEAASEDGSTDGSETTSAPTREAAGTSATTSAGAWSETPTDSAPEPETTETGSSPPPADSSVQGTSTAPDSSDEPAPRSECDQCLYDTCGAEENTCFGDLVCLQLVDALLSCSDQAADEGMTLDECFTPYVDAAYVSSPESVFAFYTWTDCLTSAECPVCE